MTSESLTISRHMRRFRRMWQDFKLERLSRKRDRFHDKKTLRDQHVGAYSRRENDSVLTEYAPGADRKAGDASLASVNSAYARWAPVYDAIFDLPLAFGRRAAINQANQLQGDILEVGVGTGLSLPAYGRHLTITGIDLSTEMLARARDRIARKGLNNIKGLHAMDAGKMALPDASFDGAVVMYVMTVVPDPAAVLAELERIVRPGGTVIIVNHFKRDSGFRAALEQFIARWSKLLGWDPVFPKARILQNTRMTLVSDRQVPPLGLFSVLVFRR